MLLPAVPGRCSLSGWNATPTPCSWGRCCAGQAAGLLYWAPTLVTGILQTESYARALFEAFPDSDETLGARLAGRMDRQQILARPRPPMVTVLLDELALGRCVGGAEVMRDQLTRLADASLQARIVLQVIPAAVGGHPGLEGAVSIADPDDGGPAIVYLESLATGRTTIDPDIIAKIRAITDVLRGEALTRAASREMIMKVAAEQWTP